MVVLGGRVRELGIETGPGTIRTKPDGNASRFGLALDQNVSAINRRDFVAAHASRFSIRLLASAPN